ncbi:hypothetical protein P154DRAFT_598060, partial [Amniculicola lignicola CBS 123094]
ESIVEPFRGPQELGFVGGAVPSHFVHFDHFLVKAFALPPFLTRKTFVIKYSARYIWANVNHDIIHLRRGLIYEDSFPEKSTIRNMRIELGNNNEYDDSNFFYHGEV